MSEQTNNPNQANSKTPDGSTGKTPANPASTSHSTATNNAMDPATVNKPASATKSSSSKSKTDKANTAKKESKEGNVNLAANPGSQNTVKDIQSSEDFEKIYPKLVDGKKVTLDEYPGFYFELEQGRLKRYTNKGIYIDSAPLYTFQEKTGWKIKS